MKQNKKEESLLWHDYETFGADTFKDRPSQFAALRTDAELNVIDDPINIYCKPSKDYLPHPLACLITKITPQLAEERGLNEASFANKILTELSVPGTCGVGYNSLRFDDEMSRNLFYKNLLDPYEREWKNGNSRWDLINVVRLASALNPGLINHVNAEGKKTFRLEELSKLNGFSHESAHDALSDIYATIQLAKHIKDNVPDLYKQLYQQRLKSTVQNNFVLMKPFLIADSYFGEANSYTSLVMPLAYSGKNKNEVYCIKISEDINSLVYLSPEEIVKNMYMKKEERDENFLAIPIHSIQINKCPVFVPASQITKQVAQNLNISGDLCKSNMALVQQYDLVKKVSYAMSIKQEPEREKRIYFSAINNKPIENDPDTMIYSSFMSDESKKSISFILQHDSIDMPDLVPRLEKKVAQQNSQNLDHKAKIDERLPEMLFRYIGRNYSDMFDATQKVEWDKFCLNRITNPDYNAPLVLEDFNNIIAEVKKDEKYNNEKDKKVISDLENYVSDLVEELKKKCKVTNKNKPSI